MKNVIHLMSTHIFSGAENVACQIINYFKDDINYNMTYVSEIKENKINLEDRNINYYSLKKFNYKYAKKAIKELQPDIIHAHDIRASIIAALFYKNRKIISHVHANHENMRKLCLKTFLFNIFSKRFTKIIWVSQSAYDNYKFKDKIKDRSIVLYNVIDVNEIQEEIKKDKNEYPNYDLIYLGRLTYQKNPERLIKIIKKVVDKKANVKVAIVGDGDLRDNVKQLVNDYDLNKNIDLYGFIGNPYRILNSSKIMIMTSRYEGTPMCALEAMGLGKPIIATPTDGLINIIKNEENGYMSDEDDELIDYTIKILEDNNLLEKMKNKALKQFNLVNNIDDYKKELIEIYK